MQVSSHCQELLPVRACARASGAAVACDPYAPVAHCVLLIFLQVSIEMIEAVGHEHLPSYFATINAALKPGGKAVIQVTPEVWGWHGHQLAQHNSIMSSPFVACVQHATDVEEHLWWSATLVVDLWLCHVQQEQSDRPSSTCGPLRYCR